MENTVDQTIRQAMSDVLELPIEGIGDATMMENTDTWDSLRHMELVMAIEEKLQVEFDSTELMELVSLADIKRILAAKGVEV